MLITNSGTGMETLLPGSYIETEFTVAAGEANHTPYDLFVVRTRVESKTNVSSVWLSYGGADSNENPSDYDAIEVERMVLVVVDKSGEPRAMDKEELKKVESSYQDAISNNISHCVLRLSRDAMMSASWWKQMISYLDMPLWLKPIYDAKRNAWLIDLSNEVDHTVTYNDMVESIESQVRSVWQNMSYKQPISGKI